MKFHIMHIRHWVLSLFLTISFLYSIHGQHISVDTNLTQYVNPFIGTGGHGHTFPGATMPFGMMQLSPDTRLTGWDGCSGYHYSDNYIYGFSHTHLSGTGVSDYADILLMPTDTIVFNNGADGNEGYRSHFSHENEVAEPAYYNVHLDSTDIKVELTVSQRTGIHRYHFPTGEDQIVILDLEHRDKLLDHNIKVINGTTLSGYRFSEAWADDQRLYFYMKFSEPFENVLFNTIESERKKYKSPTKLGIRFDNPENNAVTVKVGISAVDEEGAKMNMQEELGELSFAEAREKAQKIWQEQLSKVRIKTDDRDKKVNFYTALYHSMIAPNLYQDVDGRYRGMDKKIYHTDEFQYYTVFSLWDTYRATHPLYTILEQERTNDFINTFLAKYKEGGIIPIWDLSACYTGCMIGYHSIPVIADAYMKGIRGYDTELALQAMIHSADRDHLGLKSHKKYGFIPIEEESESVSKTLEYAYDDWGIAQVAKDMNDSTTYTRFIERAQYYKNQFDPETGFMRGRMRNKWFSPFDPYEVNFNYTEANSWQYSFYVPQDIKGLIELHGGKENLEQQIDKLFSAERETSGRHQADITGLIGQYAHGNEPSHHMAYLYNYVNKPYKTQEKVHEITNTLYKNAPDGISGNEDCGQMSAWYVFSTLGFYPVTPASNQYIIGTPSIKQATIKLENGKEFTIQAENLSDKNIYIDSVSLNGENYPYSFIRHKNIMNGDTLVFMMTDTATAWGTDDKHIPMTSIEENPIVPLPYIERGNLSFEDSTEVELGTVDSASTIYYKVLSSGSESDSSFRKYSSPFKISEKSALTVYGQRGEKKSAQFTTEFSPQNPDLEIELGSEYANQYSGGGKKALIDGIKGTKDFRTGTWQGYQNQDLTATLHLENPKFIDSVHIGFLQDQKAWIFLPSKVTLLYSTDGKKFKELQSLDLNSRQKADQNKIERINFNISKKVKSIKIIAKNIGGLPSWHIGHKNNGKAWIFADEIEIYDSK